MLNKISHRILIGFGVPVIFLLLLGVIMSITNQKLVALEEDIKEATQAVNNTNELAYNMARMVGGVRGYYIYTSDRSFWEVYNNSREALNKNKQALQNLKDAQLKEASDQIVRLAEEIERLVTENFSLIDANKLTEAKEQMATVRLTKVEDIRASAIQTYLNRLNKNRQEIQQAHDYIIFLTMAVTLLTIAATILVAWWVVLPLSKQMPTIIDAADKISEGDLRQTVEVTRDGTELEKLLVAFQNMTKNLNLLIHQVQKSGIQITTSTTQIAASGKQLEATVTEQAASTNQVAATAKEIAATANQLVKTMDEVAYTSQSTATSAADSQKDLNQMEQTMRALTGATGTISTKLGTISEKANNINSIITTITKVADQTNLLSLNAAIEAEKAGEYGTGFAVVAREIRRLADQTAVATLDIENMVKEMQGAVSTGVMEMDKFTKEVEKGVEDVVNISNKLELIIDQVQTLTPRFQQVSGSMEGQSQGAQQISQAMVQLTEASTQTIQSLREVNSTLNQLNDVAQALRHEVSRFKVADLKDEG